MGAYAAYGMVILIMLCLGMCILAPTYSAPVAQVPQPVVSQPVYQNNPDPMVGVLAGVAIGTIMSNGMRYDGHNGYMDSHYAGPPRTIVVN